MNTHYKMLNREINRLYRQLGKVVYEGNNHLNNQRKIKAIISRLDKKIQQIESVEEERIKLPNNAKILEPEKNEDGLMVYYFCSHCKTGNNPKSTHCMHCYNELK